MEYLDKMKVYQSQLKQGKKVEREHARTYNKMRVYEAKTGKCMPRDQFYEDIAKDHLKENSQYYTQLKKAKL